jgi:hypothetical protein
MNELNKRYIKDIIYTSDVLRFWVKFIVSSFLIHLSTSDEFYM